MRRRLGVAAGVAAGVAFGATVLAVLAGPDDVVGLPSRTLRSDGVAVVTNPNLVSRVGPVVHLSARRSGGPSDVDLVLALGHTEDVRSYVGGARHDVVVQVLPEVGKIRTRQVDGAQKLPAPPVGQDFWVLQQAGRDAVSVRWPTQDGVWSWALLNADGSAGVAADVSLGVEVPGLFGWSLGVLLADLLAVAGVVAAPRVLAARRRTAAARPADGAGRRAAAPGGAASLPAPPRPTSDTVVIPPLDARTTALDPRGTVLDPRTTVLDAADGPDPMADPLTDPFPGPYGADPGRRR